MPWWDQAANATPPLLPAANVPANFATAFVFVDDTAAITAPLLPRVSPHSRHSQPTKSTAQCYHPQQPFTSSRPLLLSSAAATLTPHHNHHSLRPQPHSRRYLPTTTAAALTATLTTTLHSYFLPPVPQPPSPLSFTTAIASTAAISTTSVAATRPCPLPLPPLPPLRRANKMF